MMSFIIEILLVYLAMRFIFNFILPLYRTTRVMSDKVKEMNEHLRSQNYPQARQPQSQPAQPTAKKEGEYIDYEEVK